MAQPQSPASPFPPAHSVRNLQLKVSRNGRYLTSQDGTPFFYLADTAWTLFKRLSHDEVEEYLTNRVAKGFTVIQAYVLRGLHVKNVNGDLTLLDGDPTRPNEAFFKNVDWIVNRANELGLVMGLVVTYGEHVQQVNTQEQVFDPSNAAVFGRYLGSRYRDNAVIWYLGGDRQPVAGRAVWQAVAHGLKQGSRGEHLVSYHGPGPRPGPTDYSSSFWFHNEDWLDFNTIQSGHRSAVPNYEFVAHDYALKPTKPTIDMESRYENHPDGSNPQRIDAHQAREAGYWAMLAGAAGHGYGCNDMWQFYNPERMPAADDISFPFARLQGVTHWRQAMDFDGSFGVGLMRKLFELRPWHHLVPDQGLITAGRGEGEDHVQAARARDKSFAIAYLPFGHPVRVYMSRLAAPHIRAQWYDPRQGTWIAIGQYSNTGIVEFTPPSAGEQEDWALVLDNDENHMANEW